MYEQNGVSLVVVDDDRSVCEMMARQLRRYGYHTTSLFDGLSALEHVRGLEPDVLLIDQGMPGLSGTEVIEKLTREKLRTASVLFTAMDSKEVVRNAFKAGAVDVLFKPVLPRHLSQAIEDAVTHARQNAEHGRCLRQLKDVVGRLSSSEEQLDATAESAPDAPIHVGELVVDQAQRLVFCGGNPCDLSPLEFRVLLQLARCANQVVTHQSLAMAARGRCPERWEAREFTKQHIRNIRRKIGDSAQNSKFIHTIHSEGYRLSLL